MDDERRIAEHIKTLSICHYVYAGLAACGSCLGGFYIAMGALIGEAIKHAPQSDPAKAPPPEFVHLFTMLFTGIGVAIVVVALTVAVLCVLSARAMSQRRNRTFSLVVASILCLSVPLGTTLGVFTLVVLTKPAAERLYAPPA